MNKVMVSFGLGLIIGIVVVPAILAEEVNHQQEEPEWCFRHQFDSDNDFSEFRKANAGEEFNTVFIKRNGKKLQVFTKCFATTLPHQYLP